MLGRPPTGTLTSKMLNICVGCLYEPCASLMGIAIFFNLRLFEYFRNIIAILSQSLNISFRNDNIVILNKLYFIRVFIMRFFVTVQGSSSFLNAFLSSTVLSGHI